MTSANYKDIASKIKFEGRTFINGKYVHAIDGKIFKTINPATGEVLCSVNHCNEKLIEDCINEVANDAPIQFQCYGELIDKVFGEVGPTEPSLTSLNV